MPERSSDLLITGARLYAPSEPFADSLYISEGRIQWVGQREAANVGAHVQIIDVRGALIAPGFVDAHVHATNAGLHLLSLDLSAIRSARQLLDAIEKETRRLRGAPIIGHGWDETSWEDPTLPSTTEIDRASFGSVVYLSRIDVHSALVSTPAALLAPSASNLAGWSAEGPVFGAAHGAIREQLLSNLTDQQIDLAQETFIQSCLAHGIVSIHECAGPQISNERDFRALLGKRDRIEVVGYWGELGRQGIERARDLGAHGAAGDLFIDGSIGSHTALLEAPYQDDPTIGVEFVSSEQVREHIYLSMAAGIQPGFHAIGDRALRYISDALREINRDSEVRRVRPRIEHAEMFDANDLELWRGNGLVASVQPLFDAAWGSSMYPVRLGAERAGRMNPWASMQSRGLILAFGSDAPVTVASPWEWVRASLYHNQNHERITARAAFNAATRGGRRAALQDDAGVLAVGAVADLAIWDVGEYVIQTPDHRISAWSTDERSGTPALPLIEETGDLPECIATLISGEFRYRRDTWFAD